MKEYEKKEYNVAVIGGGIAGICTAIASARNGASTILIHDRSVLGGNASSEIRMHIVGANCHGQRLDARETGILEEILLENKMRNPTHSFSMLDTILWEKTKYQKNLDIYLNSYMHSATVKNDEITDVKVVQMNTEKNFLVGADIFVDCSGDGILSNLAKARYRIGREAKNEYNEPGAVEVADKVTMGNSILFQAKDAGRKIDFIKPDWAYTFDDDDLMKHCAEITSGYWWVEVGGTKWDTIKDGDEIRDELLKIVFGIWDHIKNRGQHGADNMALEWVGFLPGKRESRRVIGDYILKEQDLIEGKIFEDAVAYGGWHIDSHPPERFRFIAKGVKQTQDVPVHLDDLYTIPYRSLYSADIKNLMLGGRIISATHRAFASTRVMGTCAVIGQAVGTAAAMAVSKQVLPKDICKNIKHLQQQLLKDNCYIPGVVNNDENDLALSAKISCSTQKKQGHCNNVINGISRGQAWVSKSLKQKNQWINIGFDKVKKINEIRLTFDSDLSREIMPSLSKWIQDRQNPNMPQTLIKDYKIYLLKDKKIVYEQEIKNNYQRHYVHKLSNQTSCTDVKIEILSTHGCDEARIFEIRVY